MKKCVVALLAVAMVLCLLMPAMAEESIEDRLSAMEGRIAELEERVAVLEGEQDTPEQQDMAEQINDSEEESSAASDSGGIRQLIAGRDDFMVVDLTAENFKDYFDFDMLGTETQYDSFGEEVSGVFTYFGFVNLAAQQGWHVCYSSDDFAVEIRINEISDGIPSEQTMDFSSINHDMSTSLPDSYSLVGFEVERIRGYVIFAREEALEISPYVGSYVGDYVANERIEALNTDFCLDDTWYYYSEKIRR